MLHIQWCLVLMKFCLLNNALHICCYVTMVTNLVGLTSLFLLVSNDAHYYISMVIMMLLLLWLLLMLTPPTLRSKSCRGRREDGLRVVSEWTLLYIHCTIPGIEFLFQELNSYRIIPGLDTYPFWQICCSFNKKWPAQGLLCPIIVLMFIAILVAFREHVCAIICPPGIRCKFRTRPRLFPSTKLTAKPTSEVRLLLMYWIYC